MNAMLISLQAFKNLTKLGFFNISSIRFGMAISILFFFYQMKTKTVKNNKERKKHKTMKNKNKIKKYRNSVEMWEKIPSVKKT